MTLSCHIHPTPILSGFPSPSEPNLTYVRGVSWPVSDDQSVLIAAMKVTGHAVTDFAGGSDAILFKDWRDIPHNPRHPVSRNEPHTHPRTGKELLLVKHQPMGGMIPRSPTRSHPHQGTGFALVTAMGYPAELNTQNPHVAPDLYKRQELLQFSYENEAFHITRTDFIEDDDEVLPGWTISGRPMSNAIPYEEGFLYPWVLQNSEGLHNGVSRWQHGPKGFQPIDFSPLPDSGSAFEPSLAIDQQGNWLMTARDRESKQDPSLGHRLRVWISRNQGQSWDLLINQPNARTPSPVSIMNNSKGEIIVIGNPFSPHSPDSQGRPVMKTRYRQKFAAWKVDSNKGTLSEPQLICDSTTLLGPPQKIHDAPHDNLWCLDHPIGCTLHATNNKPSALFLFRVADFALNARGIAPDSRSGCYLGLL